MNVDRWMTRTLIACQPTDSLQHVAQLLWEHDLGALPVVDAERKLVGMITDRDLCMAAFTRGTGLSAYSVASAMARKIYTVAPKASLTAAQELMRSHQIRRLPVVDENGMLVGVLSVTDLARKTMSELGARARRSACHEVTRTLAAISEPRPSADELVAADGAGTTASTARAKRKNPGVRSSSLLKPARGSTQTAPKSTPKSAPRTSSSSASAARRKRKASLAKSR